MFMPMVKIRPMWMGMLHRFMPVGVTVPEGNGRPFMFMSVVSIIVSMPMIMFQFFMRMFMVVSIFEEEKDERDEKKKRRPDLKKRDRLSESQCRKSNPEERRTREYHLRPCRA